MTPDEGLRPYVVRVTGPALADLAQAHAHLAATASFLIADEWEAGLFEALRTLAATPHRQIAERESRLMGRPTRRTVYRRTPNGPAYHLLFTVTEQANAPGGRGFVDVIHIRHAARRPLTRAEAGELRRGLNGDEGAV